MRFANNGTEKTVADHQQFRFNQVAFEGLNFIYPVLYSADQILFMVAGYWKKAGGKKQFVVTGLPIELSEIKFEL